MGVTGVGIRATEVRRAGTWEHLHPVGHRQSPPVSREDGDAAGLQRAMHEEGQAPSLRERLQEAVVLANQMVSGHPRRLSFELHDGAGRMVVRVIDLDTNEVIRQIPPEQVLGSLVQLREFIGLLLDRPA